MLYCIENYRFEKQYVKKGVMGNSFQQLITMKTNTLTLNLLALGSNPLQSLCLPSLSRLSVLQISIMRAKRPHQLHTLAQHVARTEAFVAATEN